MLETLSTPSTPTRLLIAGAAVLGLAAVAALAFFAWQNFYPVQASGNWTVRVAFEDVAKAAAIVPSPEGGLYVSQELKDGKGSIIHIAPGGERETLFGGLSKPDGMVAAQGGLVFSQEGGSAPVKLYRQGDVRDLFDGVNVQGLWSDGETLFAIEDRKRDGRLFRYQWRDQRLSILRDDLSEAESITRCPDGTMLYSEKEKGLIRQLSADGTDAPLAVQLDKPSYLLCDSNGLWVSEDLTHRARLLLIEPSGRVQTILSYLKAPQAITRLAEGRYLVAEGGRDRILEIRLDTPDLAQRN